MLRLEMTIRHAFLSIETKMPTIRVTPSLPNLEIQTELPAIEIDYDFARVKVDVTGSYEDLGLKRSPTLARDRAEQSRQEVLAAIARTAGQGDRLAAIEQGTDVASEAAALAWPQDHQQVNITFAPKQSVPVDVESGDLSIEAQSGTVSTHLDAPPVGIDVQQGYVKYSLARRPELIIQVVGENYSVLA